MQVGRSDDLTTLIGFDFLDPGIQSKKQSDLTKQDLGQVENLALGTGREFVLDSSFYLVSLYVS